MNAKRQGTRSVQFYLPYRDHQALKLEAAVQGKTIAELMRLAASQIVAKYAELSTRRQAV